MHIEDPVDERKINLVGQVPSTQLLSSSRQPVKLENSFTFVPQLDGHQNSFEKIKITYPSLTSREPSAKKESVFYVKGFSFGKENSFQEPFLEKNKSDFFTDILNGSMNRDYQYPSFSQNRQHSDLFGGLGKQSWMKLLGL